MDTMKLETTPTELPDADFWYQDPEQLMIEWERSQMVERNLFWLATALAVVVPAIAIFGLGLMIGMNR